MSINSAPSIPRLSVFQRQILDLIRAKSHLKQGVCQATKTLAERFGVSVRYVQAAIKRLRELGLIDRVWDYGLRTRRRLYATGSQAPSAAPEQPPETPPEAPPMNALLCAESTNGSALTGGFPPIRALKREERELNDDDPKVEIPPAPLPPSMPPDPSSSFDPRKPKSEPEPDRRKATPEEVAQVVGLAARIFPEVLHIEAQVKAEARRCRSASDEGGLGWVEAALRGAQHARARSFGYVVRTLDRWRTQGYATPTVPPPPRGDSAAPGTPRPAKEIQFTTAPPDFVEHMRRAREKRREAQENR